jgi:nicotinamidase-related amidase
MRRALIVIDVQNDYFNGTLPLEYPDPAQSLRNICAAMDAAKEAGIPVVVVQNLAPANAPIFAEGGSGAELLPEITARGWDLLVRKSLPDAFSNPELEPWLKSRDITLLTVAGYMTQNCDDATIRRAVHLGYAVEFLGDASGTLAFTNQAGHASAEDIHRLYLVVLQSRFAAVLETEEWIAALKNGSSRKPEGIWSSNRRARGMEP